MNFCYKRIYFIIIQPDNLLRLTLFGCICDLVCFVWCTHWALRELQFLFDNLGCIFPLLFYLEYNSKSRRAVFIHLCPVKCAVHLFLVL